MTKTTVTAKVTPEIVEIIASTGYSITDVLQIGIDLFLALNKEQRDSLILSHLKNKKQERLRNRIKSKSLQVISI